MERNTLPVAKRAQALEASRSSIIETFLSGRSPRTFEAYRADLQDFSAWIGVDSPEEAARVFLSEGKGQANQTAHAYKSHLLEKGLSPSTVNRRLAALRSLCKMSRLFGWIDYSLDVEGVKSESYRDTRGPGREGVHRVLEAMKTALFTSGGGSKAKRDQALVRLLYDIGLRRGEAVALDLEDLDLQAGTVSILGKGRTEKEALSLPDQTIDVLSAWVAVRGSAPGPLFFNMDRAGKGSRLTGRSVARIVAAWGKSLGLNLRPHGLRHSAITEALDATGGNVRAVQRFSRHKKLETLLRYDDNRLDIGGDVARLVAGRV